MLTAIQKQVLHKVVHLLQPLEIVWALTGSASFSLQGMDMGAHDLDLQTDERGAYAIGHALERFVIQPVGFSSAETIRSHFGKFNMDGVSIEVMGDIQKFHNGKWEDIVDLLPLIRTVTFHNHTVPVLDLRYEQEAYRKMGRIDRANSIEAFIKDASSNR